MINGCTSCPHEQIRVAESRRKPDVMISWSGADDGDSDASTTASNVADRCD